MMKPKRLKKGDTVALVSLSWGGIGDKEYIHKYHIAQKRLRDEFGLNLIAMPHALKGSSFVAKHPKLRTQDLMDAFNNPAISAIFAPLAGMMPSSFSHI